MNIIERPITANFEKGRNGGAPGFIVYHITAGYGMDGVWAWFNNPASQASAHYCVGQDGSVVHYVQDENTAWANGYVTNPDNPVNKVCPGWNPNYWTISIEVEAKPGDKLTDAQLTSLAELTQYLHDKHGISIDRQHLIGHNEIDPVTRAQDPISVFSVDDVIAKMKGTAITTAEEAIALLVDRKRIDGAYWTTALKYFKNIEFLLIKWANDIK